MSKPRLSPEERKRRKREGILRWQRKNTKKCTAYSYKWQRKNRAHVLAVRRLWYANNPEKRKRKRPENPVKKSAAHRLWRQRNIERVKAKDRADRIKNRAKDNARRIARYATDPKFRLRQLLRGRIHDALACKDVRKSKSTMILTGCDIVFLMGYLEARFKPGMTWKNHGTVWEIDHRIPCASYDLTDESHQRSCFHYSNLQPLFKGDNASKGAKMPAPHQAELL